MKLPNFIIIGAARAGTTSLYHYLDAHPQVFMSPIKETNYFSLDWENFENNGAKPPSTSIRDLQGYSKLFNKGENHKAIGEASPWYFYAPEAHRRIYDLLPEIKIIAILRDPSERAYSMYMKFIRDGLEPCQNFMEAVYDEDKSIRYSWENYIVPGFYYQHLQRYLGLFKRENIKVLLYDDFCCCLENILAETYEFLEVDKNFSPPDLDVKYNISGIPKNASVNILAGLNPIWQKCREWVPESMRYKISSVAVALKNKNLDRKSLQAEERSKLIEIYKEDILNLQQFLQRDLSKWLE